MDWTKILEGPRGRQLCVLVAMSVEREQWPATSMETVGPLADAYFSTEVGQPGVSFFTVASDDGAISEEPVASDVADIMVALKNLTVRGTDASVLPEALKDVVSSARYWQKPDRRDVLFEEPEVVKLLKPWAEVLGRLPETAWWSNGANLDHQYLVEPKRDEGISIFMPKHEEWRASTLEDEMRAQRERPLDPAAAYSGMWWSTPMADGTTPPWPTGALKGQPLAVSLLEDRYYASEDAVWAEVEVPENAKIFEIATGQDWVELCRDHPLKVSASRRHDWYACTGRPGDWVIPDWSEVAKQWDGIHLPLSAYLELVGRALPVDDRRATVIAGWSPGMTYWLTPLAGLRE